MKTSKRISLLFILAAGLIFPTLQGCQKYPDGPFMSFESRIDRVTNTWKVDNYKKNGNDYTSLMSDYSETYTKNMEYSYKWGSFSGNGSWAFQNDDKEVRITGINNQESLTLVILKLEETQFWYYYMDGNDRKEFHMIQK